MNSFINNTKNLPKIEKKIRLQDFKSKGNNVEIIQYKECINTPSKFIDVIISRLITMIILKHKKVSIRLIL